MGMHAQDCVNMSIDHEAEWDEYFAGGISDEEAYEKGILDSQGYADAAQLNRVIDRNEIGNYESLDRQLRDAQKDLMLSDLGSNNYGDKRSNKYGNKRSVLNQAAIDNLKKPRPTCNVCGEMMKPRDGKYGKFYFCSCPDQCTVSDKYWQSVRR